MHVDNIQLKNLRSFKDSGEIKFSKGINLLVGHNNAGKSTVLKAIQLLQQHSNQLSTKDIRINEYSAEIKTKLSNLKPQYLVTNKGGIPVKDIKKGILLHYIAKTATHSGFFIQSSEEPYKISILPILNKEPENFIYLFLSKRKSHHSYQSNVNEDNSKTISETLEYLSPRILKITQPGMPSYIEYENACKEILNLPTITTSPISGNNNGVVAGFSVTKADKININDMGEGIPNMLGLIVDLCYTDGEKLFLIEEPENDIHPKALKKLLDLIIKKSENNQFIISTHSNIVTKYLGSRPDTKIFRVDMELENRIPTSIITELDNKPETRIELLEDLGYEVYDFDLYKGYLILEEASAEDIIDALIQNFIPELHKTLKVLSTKGSGKVRRSLDNFMSLFTYIHQQGIYKNKAWIIIDNGKDEQKIIKEFKKTYKKQGWTEDHFQYFNEHHFENYYPKRFKKDIEEILNEKEYNRKSNLKTKLQNKIKDFFKNETDTAKQEFAVSAAEVIEKLKAIDKELNKSS